MSEPGLEPLEDAPKVGGSRLLEWLALGAVVLVAAGLRFWRLDQNGFGNPYYGACVRSMLASWTNFFFASFDQAGMVTVDKPPVALWVQAISAKVLGYSGFAVLMPQALMGTGSVVLTYYLVRRAFGATAGLLAGLALAVTPICVAVDRDNLPDPALVFVLLLAAWALVVASETGRWRPLLVSTALVGLAFNIKMLAAFVVLPTFYLVYLVAAPVRFRTRLLRLTGATAMLIAVSLSWPIAVELTPKSSRPYIGGSRNNSALELALGYNGIARIMGMGGRGPGGMGPGGPAPVSKKAEAKPDEATKKDEAVKKDEARPDDDNAPPLPPPPGGPGGPGAMAGGPGGPPFGPGGPGGRGGMPMFGGVPGLLRFTNPIISTQITWLFPMALLGSLAAFVGLARVRPIGTQGVTLGLWLGWLGTHWVVFTFAQGIFHEYYTTVMGPAVAALVGIGVVSMWDAAQRGGWRTVLLPVALVATAAGEAAMVFHYPTWRVWLLPLIGTGVGVGVVGWFAARWLAGDGRWSSIPWAGASVTLALASLLVAPTLWSSTTVIGKGVAMMPAADPELLGVKRDKPAGGMPFGGPPGMESGQRSGLIAFLKANRHDEPVMVVGMSSMGIAPIIIETGETAVALGGFMGGDPALTKAQFIEMVNQGRWRFMFIEGGPGGGGRMGPPGGFGGGPGGPPGGGPPGGGPPMGGENRDILAWVREHGKRVDAKLWQNKEADKAPEAAATTGPGMFRRMMGQGQLYDCKPDLGWVTPGG